MDIEVIDSPKGKLSRCILDAGMRITSVSDFLDLLVNCPTDTVVINKESLTEGFFDLKSGIAGEFLQKVSNYRRRLIVLGDYRGMSSKAFRDFIHEGNQTGKVIFTEDLQQAIELLT